LVYYKGGVTRDHKLPNGLVSRDAYDMRLNNKRLPYGGNSKGKTPMTLMG